MRREGKQRKTASVLAVMLAVLVTAGCGADKPAEKAEEKPAVETVDASTEESSTEAAPEEQADANVSEPAETKPSARDGKPFVGVVTDEGGIEDASFNQSAWEGLQRLSGVIDCETEFLESPTQLEVRTNLEKLVDDGATLCWAVGYNCAEGLLKAAGDHPDVQFAIVDYEYSEIPDNVTCVMFRAQEPSFLVGYVAGCVTKTGKVGFVGGETNEVIDQFQYGYQAGVWYASQELNKAIEVETIYANTFVDAAKGRAAAEELIGRGCDVIYHAAGETGIGVIEAASGAGCYVIGVDKDQSYLAPDYVLTSALKYVNTAVTQVSQQILDGTVPGGQTVRLGLSEDAVGVSEEHTLFPDEVYDAMLKLQERIFEGAIVPPYSSETYEAFIGD